MSILPRRFERIKNVLDCRMKNLTVLVEDVNKPHNLSAILRTCDAAGVFEANFISKKPSEGPAAGGITITIFGSGFGQASHSYSRIIPFNFCKSFEFF